MKCADCHVELRKRKGTLNLLDPRFGPIQIRDAEYWVCAECGSRLYSAKTARGISASRDQARTRLIRQRPVGEFVTAEEAAREFGVSRQAIHKNVRIYSTKLGRKPVYLRQSLVLHYREGMDGRLSLWPYNTIDRDGSGVAHPSDVYSCPTAGSTVSREAGSVFDTARSELEVVYGT